MGLSWGSAVGLAVAAKQPDLLYAYVGVATDRLSRQRARRLRLDARAGAPRRQCGGDQRELEALRPFPGDGPLDVGKTTIERKWNTYYAASSPGEPMPTIISTPDGSRPNTAADRKAWDDGSDYTMAALVAATRRSELREARRLDVPIVLFLGRHDYTVPAPIAAAWAVRLRAPKKTVVWFENSAHLPMVEEPGRALAALLEHVRPLAVER